MSLEKERDRDSASAYFQLLESGTGLGVIVYRDLVHRRALVEELRSLSPTLIQAERFEDLLERRDEPLVLTTAHERELVEACAANRDRLLDRSAPAVLLLLAGGEALDALPDLPSLASWLGGRIVDPTALDRRDLEADRRRFEESHGETPERWLTRFHQGEIPDTTRTNLIAIDALAVTTGTAHGRDSGNS